MSGFGNIERDSHEKWRAGLQHEVGFWKQFLTLPEWKWHRDARFSPDFGFPLFGRELLGDAAPRDIEVLDVGSGPATTIGLNWPGHEIRLTTVDPLARPFNNLLVRCGYPERATIIQGAAETVSDLFEMDRFHLVYCGNALDHTYAPLEAIRKMLEVVRPGGWLVMICYENEAETEAYSGLHQWNFCIREQRLVLWNKEGSVDVFASVKGCERNRVQQLAPNSGDTRNRIMASIRKRR